MNPSRLSQGRSIESLAPDVQQRLAEVLDSYLTDLEHGRAHTVEELTEKHPELAEPLRTYLGSLDFLHEATASLRVGGQTQPTPDDLSKKQLGDYVIIREIGRGGMGMVYEATQLSLGRRVALKVLPFAAVLDQRQIARFYNEAQAAAQLHHPHIVPVYAVGCDRGVHFYAMQYIEGQPLDVAIRQLRRLADALPERAASHAATLSQAQIETAGPASATWKSFSTSASLKGSNYFRTVARMGIEAAEGLDHAHQCGIVHRDIKPSNLLLDELGAVWITDFGLARFHAGGSLTATGDVMGTIRYMSPEQIAGKPGLIDQRTDVYSLGITLYELATLHEAFAGADRQAFLRWISDDEPRPPRQVNPAVPLDLETILLKAISKSPQDRYTTAKELAEDLRHFLDGRPVLARRASLADRASKWARRHKSLLAASVVLVAVVLVASLLSTVLIATEHAKTKAALAEAEANFRQAEENLRRADTHFHQLREVVDRFGAHHAEQLKDLPGAEPVRRELLLDTLKYYRGFIRYAADDPTLQTDLAVAYANAAAVSEQIGDKPEALNAYRQATRAFAALAAAHPEEPAHRADLALCHNNVGLLLAGTGKPDEAEAAYRQALTMQKQLAVEHPESAKYQSDLALTYGNMGLRASAVNRGAEAERVYHEAIRIQQQLVAKNADNPDYLHNLAITYNNLSFLQAKSDPLQAEDSSQKARSIQEKLAEAHPTHVEYQSDLALSYNNLGALENHNDQLDRAEASYQRAIAIQEHLVRKSPSVIRFRRDLAISHNNLGRVYSKSKQSQRAIQAFESARTIMQQLADDYPHELSYRSSLGGILNNLGLVFEQLARLDQAAEMYQQAIRQQRSAYEHAQQLPQFRELLDKHYANYRRVLEAMDRWEDYAAATIAQAKLCHDDPEPLYRIAVELAAAAGARGQDEASVPAHDAAVRAMARQRYADLAVETLATAMDARLEHTDRLRDDPQLGALRSHPKFKILLERLHKSEK